MYPIGKKVETSWRIISALLVLFLAAVLLTQRQEAWGQEVKPAFLLVAHPDVGISGVEREVLADIFLRQRTTWPDGSMVHPADQKPIAPVRALFSNHVLHRSVQAVRSYWQQRIFSGRGVPPPELESDEAVLNYVRGRSGAVGYVSLHAEVKSVRVIALE